MRRVILSLGFAMPLIWLLIAPTASFGQICTPGTNYTEVGLFPEVVPTGALGQPYSEKLDAALPKDTTFGNITLDFCSYRIDSTQPNLADFGLSFDCNEPGCAYNVDHDLPLNFGCVVISGTPTQLFDDSIQVFISAKVGNYDDQTDVCTILDSTTFAKIVIKVAFKIDSTVTSVDVTKQLDMNIFPNPTEGDAILRMQTLTTDHTKITIMDIQGKVVATAWDQQLFAGEHTISLPTATLDEGMYLVRVETAKQGVSQLQKLIIRK
ncbi:MAG: T9SS type A sorting domain-containing protein [Bacteroidota bacterium]